MPAMDFLPPDYSLVDLFHDVAKRDRRNRLTGEFGKAGISIDPKKSWRPLHDPWSAEQPWYSKLLTFDDPSSSDAARLSKLMTYNKPADPQIQRRFLAMLKQMGYLPNQAY